MRLTRTSGDQYLLIAVATAAAYAAWVIYDPTLGECTTAGIFHPLGRVAIVWAWLISISVVRPLRGGTFTWPKFATGAVAGGLLEAVPLVFLHWIWEEDDSLRSVIQPVIWACPYAAISGLYAAFEATPWRAARSAVAVLFVQVLVDFLFWLPTTCVY